MLPVAVQPGKMKAEAALQVSENLHPYIQAHVRSMNQFMILRYASVNEIPLPYQNMDKANMPYSPLIFLSPLYTQLTVNRNKVQQFNINSSPFRSGILKLKINPDHLILYRVLSFYCWFAVD